MSDLEKYQPNYMKKRWQQFLAIVLICLMIPCSNILNVIAMSPGNEVIEPSEEETVNEIIKSQLPEKTNMAVAVPIIEIASTATKQKVDILPETFEAPPEVDEPKIEETVTKPIETTVANETYVEPVSANETKATVEEKTTEVVYEILNTVYATDNVYVRAAANIKSESLGMVQKNEELIAVGQDFGWTKIKYNDDFAYISTYYISETPETEEVIETPTETDNPVKYGTVGRLYVNGFDVAVYNDGESGLQQTVDAQDSASYFRVDETIVICDHTNQGFSAIKGVQVGDECYIEYSDGTRLELVCVGTDPEGHNLLTDLVDHDYHSIYGTQPIVMYTCNECWQNVTLVFWDIK